MNKVLRYVKCRFRIANLKVYLVMFAVFFLLETTMSAVQYRNELLSRGIENGNVLEFFIYNAENVFVLYLFVPIIIFVFCIMSMCFERSHYFYVLKGVNRKSFFAGNIISAFICSVLFVTIYFFVTLWCGMLFGMKFYPQANFITTPFGLAPGSILLYIGLVLYWFTLMMWFQAAYYCVLNRYLAIMLACCPILYGFIVFKNLIDAGYKFSFFSQVIQSVLETGLGFRFCFWFSQIVVLIVIAAIRLRKIDLQEKRRI